MKICPKCRAEYDDLEMRFCIRDGTALTEVAAAPQNVAAPAELTAAPDRFTVSLQEPFAQSAQVALPNVAPTVKPMRQKSNAALFAALAVLLLLAGAALGAAVYYFAQPKTEVAQTNRNVAVNANNFAAANDAANLNVGALSNVNANLNANSNSNLNRNANVKPSSSPKPSPSPINANQNQNAAQNINAQILNVNANAAANTPSNAANAANPDAQPSPSPTAKPNIVSGGIMSGKATSLPKPAYPAAAKAARASGAVNVQITVDESGRVIEAAAISGHALLRQAAVQAARQARFAPTLISGQPVKVVGTIVYNFTPD